MMFIYSMFTLMNALIVSDVLPTKHNVPYFIITYFAWLYGFTCRLWGDNYPSWYSNIIPNLRIFVIICVFLYSHCNMDDINLSVCIEAQKSKTEIGIL